MEGMRHDMQTEAPNGVERHTEETEHVARRNLYTWAKDWWGRRSTGVSN